MDKIFARGRRRGARSEIRDVCRYQRKTLMCRADYLRKDVIGPYFSARFMLLRNITGFDNQSVTSAAIRSALWSELRDCSLRRPALRSKVDRQR